MLLADNSAAATQTIHNVDFAQRDRESQQLSAIDLLLGLPEDVHPAAAALALLRDRSLSTDLLKKAAIDAISRSGRVLETFVPLYTTNHCDSECKMCAMRKSNTRLIRKHASKREIEDQLQVLFEHERVRGVGFLTGEYDDQFTRLASAFRIGWAARTAFDMGFKRVYLNIGSMEEGEIREISDWVRPGEPVTMCVFQESYDRDTYQNFMGSTGSAPKSDYDRRIGSFDRWLDAGFTDVNPGVLIGLHDNLEEELVSLLSQVVHLRSRSARVDISLPRLRPANGTRNVSKVDDEGYLRILAVIALVCPNQRLVLTTREPESFQAQAIDLCGVFSPGSPDVAPYSRDTQARNSEDSSQFLVADLRRPRSIISSFVRSGRQFANFELL